MVIVLVGALAFVGSNLIGNFVGGYVDATERQELASAGRLAVERTAREIRQTVPNSVLCPGGNCEDMQEMAFLRAANGGRYVAVGPDQSRLQINNDGDEFVAFGLSGIDDSQDAIVYPQDADPLYGDPSDDDSPRARIGTVTDLSTGDEIKHQLTLDGTDSVPQHSPGRRVYATDRVTALCCDPGAGELSLATRPVNDSLSATLPTDPGDYCSAGTSGVDIHLLTDRVSECSFDYNPATLTRSAIVRIFLELEGPQSGEAINWEHEVHIRNVP